MALEHELTGLAAMQERNARDARQRFLRRMKLIAEFRTIRAYRDLLLDENGELTRAGAIVLADLSAKARLGIATHPNAREGELREFAGRRALVLHLIARMDLAGVKLRDLSRKLREVESE